MKYKYKCQDNDAIIKFIEVDGLIDEIWIKPQNEHKTWWVIGFNDLQCGIKLALEKFKTKTIK